MLVVGVVPVPPGIAAAITGSDGSEGDRNRRIELEGIGIGKSKAEKFRIRGRERREKIG